MIEVTINNEPSTREVKDKTLVITKGGCIIPIQYPTVNEANFHDKRFMEFDIILRTLTEDELSELESDFKRIASDAFYLKYLIGKDDVFAMGDIIDVDDTFIKKIVPHIKYISNHDCCSGYDMKMKTRRNEYSYEYFNYSNTSTPFGLNNPRTMHLPVCDKPMQSWNMLRQLANNPKYGVIYFKTR